MTAIDVFLFLLLAAAVITDLRSDKIPNWLIIIGLVVGIRRTDLFIKNIFICIFIILIFFPVFRVGALGAGDIKCFAMLSFYLTFSQLIAAVFFTFIFAAIFSICRIIHDHSFLSGKKKVHLALPIFLGVFISFGGTYL